MPVDANFLMQRLMRGGMSRMQAAAVVGNLQRESSLNPAAYNADEGAYGLMQWRGPRWQALQQFAGQQGKSWTDPGVQADFIGHELRTTERGNARDFYKAPTIDAASEAFGRRVVRFGDKSLGERQAAARALYGGDAGQPATGAIADQATPSAPGDVSRETSAPAARATRDDIARVINPPRPRGIRGGLQSLGQSLATATFPRSSGASQMSTGGSAAAAGGSQALSMPQPPQFPGGAVPIPTSRPAPAPGLLTGAPDAASSLPGAKMGALADLAAYQDGDWYG